MSVAYILTAWLSYSDPALPMIQRTFPDRPACLDAQSEWDSAASEWLQRSQLPNRFEIVAVSRCDPADGAARSLYEANLHTLPHQVPWP